MFFGGLYVLQLKDLGPLAVEGASTMRYGYLEQGVDGVVRTVWSGVAKACTSECLADLSNIILEQSDTILKEIGIDDESINFLQNEAQSFLDTAGLGDQHVVTRGLCESLEHGATGRLHIRVRRISPELGDDFFRGVPGVQNDAHDFQFGRCER